MKPQLYTLEGTKNKNKNKTRFLTRSSDLRWKYDDGSSNEQHHEQFTGPDVWVDVTVADRRECDYDKPQ